MEGIRLYPAFAPQWSVELILKAMSHIVPLPETIHRFDLYLMRLSDEDVAPVLELLTHHFPFITKLTFIIRDRNIHSVGAWSALLLNV